VAHRGFVVDGDMAVGVVVVDDVALAAVTNGVVNDGTTVTVVVVGLWDGGGMERM